MGRKRGGSAITANSRICQGTTLRDQNTGPKNVDVSSILKTKHLQRLATWASNNAQIAPLAAFLGERLAVKSEASGVPLDPSNFLCQRCETMLQPGINCTVRIEKNSKKSKWSKKSLRNCQNNVVYTCHFCDHRNIKWGTAKGHLKGLLSSRPCHTLKSDAYNSSNKMKDNCSSDKKEFHVGGLIAPESKPLSVERCDTLRKATAPVSIESPLTPLLSVCYKPDKKRKDSGLSTNKIPTGGDSSATANSSKRRRKKWTSLRETAENNELNRRNSNSAIPFLL